ncbi:hypothetical protein lerEdw1_009907 [Lerista edwardsae]|nr:hypothetical protein lerEdw1_009907 [Lerista edwardsae]
MGLYEGYLLFEISFLLWIPDFPIALCANYSVLQVPSEVTANQGDNVTLKCPFSVRTGQSSSAKGAMSWFKGPKGAESMVVSGPHFGLTYPDSFLSPGEGLLVITNVSLEDAGTYTCQIMVWGKGETRGNGTQLHVYGIPHLATAGQGSRAQLHLSNGHLASLMDTVCSSFISTVSAPLPLQTSGFYPAPVRLTWSQAGLRLPSSQQDCTDSTASHQASSLLDLPNAKQRARYVCTIEHPSLRGPLSVQYDYEPQLLALLPPSMIKVLNLLKIGVITAIALGIFTGGNTRPSLLEELEHVLQQAVRFSLKW